MGSNRFHRVREIFARVREAPASERAALLERECAGDEALRQEIEELLASDLDATGGALAQSLKPEAEPPKTPAAIGNYRLRERLGEGGMGEVYLADQEQPIKRTVALKIIRPGMESRTVLARFESERQALAMMDHRNIARALDAGVMEDGRPYFVMEYVEGITITAYCDQERLTTNERLELLAQVCDGLHHAHQKAIIHRDIKPGNVLVTLVEGVPVPKIIDFGIAKAADEPLLQRTLCTELGQVIGTPEYMSPEQAQLGGSSVDTRTDIYSIGVLMYEVLVGVLPFDPKELRRAGFDEILRKIREDDPPRPSTRLGTLGPATAETTAKRRSTAHRLSSELRGDLDWITMKALEKDPARRYGSATEVAQDIRRHLRFEPVSAGPPGAGYRLAKFVRRHRVGVGVAGALALFLAVFLTTTIVQAGVIARERDRANEEAQGAREIAAFLTGLFRRADPGQAKGADVTAREILHAGAQEIAQLDDRPRTQAAFLETIGDVYGVIGLYDEGQDLLERAVAIRERQQPQTKAAELALAASLHKLANLLLRAGDSASGLPLARRAAEIYERLTGESLELAEGLNSVGNGLQNIGEFAESEAVHRRALALREQLGADDRDIGVSLHNLGTLRFLQDDLVEAEHFYRRAIAICEAHGEADSASMGTTLHTLAMVYAMQERFDEALELEQRSLEIREQVLGPEHPYVALSLRSLAEILAKLGQGERAEPLAARAVAIGDAAWGPDVPDVWWLRRGHAEVLNAIGRSEQALAIMEPLVERVARTEHRIEYSLHLAELADTYRRLRRYDESKAAWERCLEDAVEGLYEDSAELADHRLGFARTLRDSGEITAARALFASALGRIEAKRGADHPSCVRARAELEAMK
jgi:non-specific serine/threonine protein kinase/serine/threonine-protein kinase